MHTSNIQNALEIFPAAGLDSLLAMDHNDNVYWTDRKKRCKPEHLLIIEWFPRQ